MPGCAQTSSHLQVSFLLLKVALDCADHLCESQRVGFPPLGQTQALGWSSSQQGPFPISLLQVVPSLQIFHSPELSLLWVEDPCSVLPFLLEQPLHWPPHSI